MIRVRGLLDRVDCVDGASGMIRMIKELEPLGDLELSSEMEPSKGRSGKEVKGRSSVTNCLRVGWDPY